MNQYLVTGLASYLLLYINLYVGHTDSQEYVVGEDTNTEEFNDVPLLCKLLYYIWS